MENGAEKNPAAQGVHVLDPEAAKVPAGHAAADGKLDPTANEYDPPGAGRQDDAPTEGPNVPLGQGKHEVALALLKKPTEQATHAVNTLPLLFVSEWDR